jgi:uncharacterized glyoxalase superfamily protein PhnB
MPTQRSRTRKKAMSPPRLANGVIVFVAHDVRTTADYYRDVFGFAVVEHYDKPEPFAALYRDAVEIIVAQAKHGQVVCNRERYGAGYDAYLDPEEIEDVDELHAELAQKGATIVSAPAATAYGTYEFVVRDIDGRLVGIGRIRDRELFFAEGEPADE